MAGVIFLLILAGALSFIIFNKKAGTPIFIANIDSSKIRPEIKIYIDELYNSEITSIEHTTESIEQTKKRLPEDPKIFRAGRYRAVFNNINDKKVMIFQTEEKVGHIAPVTPGKTDIGGYVEIQKNAEGVARATKSLDNQNSLNDYTDLKLNAFELDYLIKMIYKKFEKPIDNTQADRLNSVKDYALAIMFSGKNGITEYHNQLIRNLGIGVSDNNFNSLMGKKSNQELLEELLSKNNNINKYKIFSITKSPNSNNAAVLFGLDSAKNNGCCSKPTGIFINIDGKLYKESFQLGGALEHLYLENVKWSGDNLIFFDSVIADEGGVKITTKTLYME